MVEMRTNLRALSSLVVLFNFVHADGHNPMSAPAAGEVVEAEKPYTIEWDPGTPGPVSINLHFGDTSAVPIVDETENNGTYTWTPSGVFDGKDNYYINICDKTIEDCTYTFDGRFTISDGSSSSSSSSSLVTPSSASTSTLYTTTSQAVTSPTPAPSTSSTPSSSSTPLASTRSGLSSGGKVVLGVVFGLLGAGAIVLGAFFWDRRRKQQNPNNDVYEYKAYTKAELPGEGTEVNRAELEGTLGEGVMLSTQERKRSAEEVHELPDRNR